ncbi:ComEC/Rec2 family competence protein [Planococcus plakortidis]|uniref:hypothetical protein n=1 Tax=Planococcus plakortidis TaxID=1038856 RepID=UPI00385E78DF
MAKIKHIYSKQPIDPNFVRIKSGEHLIYIVYEDNLKSFSLELLKYFYARQNENEIGNINKSIYTTIRKHSFTFSRPFFNKKDFNASYKRIEELLNQDDLENHILYEGCIVPKRNENFKTYASLVEEDGEYFLTLTNDKMIDLDWRYINGEYLEKGPSYRPYFYDFFPDSDQVLRTRLSNNQDEVYEVEFVSDEDKEFLNEESIKGRVIFSASPFKSIIVYINFLNKSNPKILAQLDKIEERTKTNIKTETNEKKIRQRIKAELPSNTMNFSPQLTVYSVGQGNWSRIKFQNLSRTNVSYSIIFDIGISKKPSKNINKIAENAVEELTENYMFILSHWDQDHIKGIVYLQDKKFEKLWIVPMLPNAKVSKGALRLAAFLHFHPNIESIFIDEKFNNQVIIDDYYLMLGKGEGRNANYNATRGGKQVKTSYNSKNNLGLILAVKKSKQKILLTGDCEYIQFPDAFINAEYRCLVVSHHGAKTNIKCLQDFGFSAVPKCTPAIVCVEDNTNYPCSNHVDMLKNLGYKVEKTSMYSAINKNFTFTF